MENRAEILLTLAAVFLGFAAVVGVGVGLVSVARFAADGRERTRNYMPWYAILSVGLGLCCGAAAFPADAAILIAMIACAGVFLIVAALVQGRSTDFRVFGDYDAQDRGWHPDLYREVKTADAAEPGGTVHVYSPDPARLLRNAKHRLAYALVSSAICVALHLWGDAVFPNVPKLAAVIPVFLLSAVLAFASLAAFLEYLRVSR